jgi:hypothetical protein
MKRIPSHRSTPQPPHAVRTLDPCALDAVRGGVSHSVVSPRDPQSGLPTGQET